MTLAEMRQTALGAVQSYLRSIGIDPYRSSAEDAWSALDELTRTKPYLIAAEWCVIAYDRYLAGNKNQTTLFNREWRAICARRLEDMACGK